MKHFHSRQDATVDYQSFPLVRVPAPGNETGLLPPALVAVDVDEDDEVHWVWTYLADGRRVVTACTVVPRGSTAHLRIRQ
jgi:hypothetical protein